MRIFGHDGGLLADILRAMVDPSAFDVEGRHDRGRLVQQHGPGHGVADGGLALIYDRWQR